MTADERRGFQPENIAAVVTSLAQMIEAHGGPDGDFAARIAQMIESGTGGATDDERRFLELAADLASLLKATSLFR